MKKLLDCIQERKVGGAYDNGFWGFSLDLKKTSIDDGCLDVIEYLIQLRSVLKVSKEAGAKKKFMISLRGKYDTFCTVMCGGLSSILRRL